MDLRSDIKVELVDHMGSDETIVRAARVSTQKDQEASEKDKQKGLIRYLLKHGHLSPFEHTSATVRVEAPLFVRDQWFRHRTMSYNARSLRFSVEDEPEFYIADRQRPIVNEGSGAHPKMAQGNWGEWYLYSVYTQKSYQQSLESYRGMIRDGIAEELARAVLPSGLYTSFYATANLRNWMQFLDKRIETVNNKPQWEIEQAAWLVEDILNDLFPIAMETWYEQIEKERVK